MSLFSKAIEKPIFPSSALAFKTWDLQFFEVALEINLRTQVQESSIASRYKTYRTKQNFTNCFPRIAINSC